MGTDPDCNCLSPALPSATQPSLSAAAGRDTAPASTRVPSSLLHATLADLEAPSQPPSSTDGGSGTEEVPAAGLGDTALAPGMKQTAPGSSAEALQDPAGTLSLALGDIPVLRGDGELVEWGTGHLPQDPGQQWGGSILPEQRGGLRTGPPTASPGAARIRPAAAVTQLRFSRMAPELRAPGSARDRARAWGWGLSRLRGPEDGGGAGPSFDSGFVLGAEQRRKEPPASEGRQEPLIYITVASVVAVLLATGGLLFYKYKSRVRPHLVSAPATRRFSPASVSPLVSWPLWVKPHFPHNFETGGRLIGDAELGGRVLFGRFATLLLQPPPLPQGSFPSLHTGPAAAAGGWRLRPRGA